MGKLFKKYPEYVKLCRNLSMEDWEIEGKLYQMDKLNGWTPITLRELISMTDEEKSKLLSFCWHDGKPRCDCIGINSVTYQKSNWDKNKYIVNWSDIDGDPEVVVGMDEEINNIGDGSWNYGLFKK